MLYIFSNLLNFVFSYFLSEFVGKGTTEDPTAEGQTSKYIDTTLKMTTDVAITEGQTSKYIDTTLAITTKHVTTDGMTTNYKDTSLIMTSEDKTTKGQTSKYIDTTLKITTGDTSTLGIECDTGWLLLGTGCYQFTLGGTRQMWLDAKVRFLLIRCISRHE